MLRWMFTFAFAVSLLLCAATVVSWVRGYFESDSLRMTYHSRDYVRHRRLLDPRTKRQFNIVLYSFTVSQIVAGRGYFEITTANGESDTSEPPFTVEWGMTGPLDLRPGNHSISGWLGFDRSENRSSQGSVYVFPIWLVTFIAAALPASRVGRAILRSIRHLKHSCTKCGYNLTGNTSGVCPECGTPVAKSQLLKHRLIGEKR